MTRRRGCPGLLPPHPGPLPRRKARRGRGGCSGRRSLRRTRRGRGRCSGRCSLRRTRRGRGGCSGRCRSFAPSPPTPSGERVGVRGQRLRQCHDDGLKHIIGLGEDIVVPEPQHAEAETFQRSSTPFVVAALLEVLAAIQLDRQSAVDAGKVQDVAIDPVLAAKLHAKLGVAKPRPQLAFGIGLAASKLLGMIGGHGPFTRPAPPGTSCASRLLLPLPRPCRGERVGVREKRFRQHRIDGFNGVAAGLR